MESYEKLLDRAYGKVKVIGNTDERFEIPKIEGRFEGKKTILNNFFQIASYLRRDPEKFLKYLLKELAVKGYVDRERIIINAKISGKKINPKIEHYVNEFVLCKECRKPDTKLIKEGKQMMLHCLACGAKHPVRSGI